MLKHEIKITIEGHGLLLPAVRMALIVPLRAPTHTDNISITRLIECRPLRTHQTLASQTLFAPIRYDLARTPNGAKRHNKKPCMTREESTSASTALMLRVRDRTFPRSPLTHCFFWWSWFWAYCSSMTTKTACYPRYKCDSQRHRCSNRRE